MRSAVLLFRLSLKRARLLLGATGLLLALVQMLRVHIAAQVHSDGQFDQIAALLPPSVRQMLGSALGSIMSFSGIVCGVYFDIGFILALLALAILVLWAIAATGYALAYLLISQRDISR